MNNNLKPIQTIPPFKRFCMTIGELPTSYLMSMSYEEQLIWFCNYLEKTVIPTINNNGLAVNELQNKYIELKSYIDNYFENLDVQEEINNKLDEMAESGQLQEIIAEYLNLITNLTFNTVNDMKNAENLANGIYVKTLGFYDLGDGGSAYYHIRNVTNEDIIDDHFIIALSNINLVAEFQPIEKDIHSKQVGLKGDDVTDETEIIQKFFDYMNNFNINKIFDSGIYVVSDVICVTTRWQQDGQSGTGYNNGNPTIKFDNASFHRKEGTNDNTYNFIFYGMWKTTVDGFCLTRNSYVTKTLFIGCWNCVIKNFEIKNLELNGDSSVLPDTIGILPSYSLQHMNFENGYCRGQLIIDPYSATVGYINSNYFNNVQFFSYGYDSNVVLKKAFSKQQIIFNECDMSYSNVSVFDVVNVQENAHITSGTSSCSILTYNCYFDSNVAIFKNGVHNNINYIDIGSRYSGTEAQNTPLQINDYLNTLRIGTSGNHVKDVFPIINMNLVYNGDMTSHTYIKNNATDNLFGDSNDNITKAYVQNYSAKNDYVRQLTFTQTTDTSLKLDARRYPYSAPATLGIMFEFVSGKCDITLSFERSAERQFTTIPKEMIQNGINIFSCCKNNQNQNKGSWCAVEIGFSNIESGTVLNIYEVSVQMGQYYIPYSPLMKTATPSS